MRFLKRKRHVLENEEISALRKEFEVLNRVPVDYQYDNWYKKFLDNAEPIFRKAVSRIPVDDLNGDMLDGYIDSIVLRMQDSAKAQYDDHLSMILHHKGIVEGDMVLARGHLANLKQDQKDLEKTLDFYRNKKSKV